MMRTFLAYQDFNFASEAPMVKSLPPIIDRDPGDETDHDGSAEKD